MSRNRRVTHFDGAHGPIGSLEMRFSGYDTGQRPTFAWTLRDHEREIIATQDAAVMMARGKPNALAASNAMCSFLLAAAEAYEGLMERGHESDNLGLFSAGVNEWAYLNSTEIQSAQLQLEVLIEATATRGIGRD